MSFSSSLNRIHPSHQSSCSVPPYPHSIPTTMFVGKINMLRLKSPVFCELFRLFPSDLATRWIEDQQLDKRMAAVGPVVQQSHGLLVKRIHEGRDALNFLDHTSRSHGFVVNSNDLSSLCLCSIHDRCLFIFNMQILVKVWFNDHQ